MTTVAEDMRDPDITCLNSSCPQWTQGKCGAPDIEVCIGRGEDRLDPCPDRKV